MEHLTADNWTELFERFPGLDGAMRTMAHRNELYSLAKRYGLGLLTEWERRRYDELRLMRWPGLDYRQG